MRNTATSVSTATRSARLAIASNSGCPAINPTVLPAARASVITCCRAESVSVDAGVGKPDEIVRS